MKRIILVLILLTAALLLNVVVENHLSCSTNTTVVQPQPSRETLTESAQLAMVESPATVGYIRELAGN